MVPGELGGKIKGFKRLSNLLQYFTKFDRIHKVYLGRGAARSDMLSETSRSSLREERPDLEEGLDILASEINDALVKRTTNVTQGKG